MLQADCRASGECRLSVIPVVTGPGQPFYPDEEGAQAILDRLNRLSYQVRVNGDGTVEPDPSGRVYDPKWREKLMEPEAEAEYESESEAESESESEDQPATDTKEQSAADTNHEKETNAAAEREAGEDSYSL